MRIPDTTVAGAPEEKPHARDEWHDRWHVNPTLSKDYDAIDGLRGIAILMVIACHVLYTNPAAGPLTHFIGGVFAAGTWGVTLFFTLSGFLISHPFWKRKVQGSPQTIPSGYGWRRFWKIYPPLALSIVLLTPIYFATTRDTSLFITAGQWLVGWPLIHPVSGRLNPVMWSLIVEVHFYVLLPLLFLCLKPISARKCLWIIFLVLLVVPTTFRWWKLSKGIHFELHPNIQIHFPMLMDAFAFGVLFAGLEHLRLVERNWARLGDAGCVLLLVSLFLMSWANLRPVASKELQVEVLTWGAKLASVMLLCCIADTAHPTTRLFSQPWLRWCGLISYEWYLFHQPIFYWARDLFGPAGGNVLKYLLIVGSSLLTGLVIAALVYHYFSLPILRYGRSRRGSL